MICCCRTCCLQAIIILWGGGETACCKPSISRVAQKQRLVVLDDRLQSNQASKLGGCVPKLRSWRFCGLWVLSYERSLILVVLNLRKNGIESEREIERCATAAAAAADVLVRRGAGVILKVSNLSFVLFMSFLLLQQLPPSCNRRSSLEIWCFRGLRRKAGLLQKAANWVPLHPPLPLGWQQKHGDDDDFNMAIIFGTGFQAKDCEADVSFFLLLLLLLHIPNFRNRNTDLLLLADFLPIALLCVLPSFFLWYPNPRQKQAQKVWGHCSNKQHTQGCNYTNEIALLFLLLCHREWIFWILQQKRR